MQSGSGAWEGRQFLRSVPTSSFAVFVAAVFLTFATVAPLTDILHLGSHPPLRLAVEMVFAGTLAITYLLVAGRLKLLPIVIAAHIMAVTTFHLFAPSRAAPLEPAALRVRLTFDAVATIIGIVGGYMLFVMFIRREGARYVRAHTEIALARDIHRLLVPPIATRLGRFEFSGMSVPSGEVGGDLVDLVDLDGRWIGYVADVSGHGVGAGLLMGMVKSAARMQLRAAQSMSALLNELNIVLFDLSKPNMFVTFAGIQFDGTSELQFSLAGHLPILHYRSAASTIDELSLAQVPLAMFGDRRYTAARVAVAPGDLFVILTDGLTEVFDRDDRELGLDGIKAIIRQNAATPLDRLRDALLAAARGHGPQQDDQTLLLIRAFA